jgi:hypothetical protein
MDECLAKGAIPFAALQAFSKKQGPYLKKNVAWAAQTQVAHWMHQAVPASGRAVRLQAMADAPASTMDAAVAQA